MRRSLLRAAQSRSSGTQSWLYGDRGATGIVMAGWCPSRQTSAVLVSGLFGSRSIGDERNRGTRATMRFIPGLGPGTRASPMAHAPLIWQPLRGGFDSLDPLTIGRVKACRQAPERMTLPYSRRRTFKSEVLGSGPSAPAALPNPDWLACSRSAPFAVIQRTYIGCPNARNYR
jgi:hypothetical protein